MQSLERKKSVLVSFEVHQRIAALRRGKQTYGDVIAESIKALEEKEDASRLQYIEDINLDRLELDVAESETDFESNYVSLETSVNRYRREHNLR